MYAKSGKLNDDELLAFEYPLIFLEIMNYICGVQILYKVD
jgi:hypothetical protein